MSPQLLQTLKMVTKRPRRMTRRQRKRKRKR
jgi:hypothetical protein